MERIYFTELEFSEKYIITSDGRILVKSSGRELAQYKRGPSLYSYITVEGRKKLICTTKLVKMYFSQFACYNCVKSNH